MPTSTPVSELLAPIADLDQLVGVLELPGALGRPAELPDPLPDPLADHAATQSLWSHQVQAVTALRRGRGVVVATGTGSGKSRCFQIPIAEAALRGHTALVVYPTKALAHDQLRALTALDLPGIRAATYDGDADDDDRAVARRRANVVLTNPEMLHYSICDNHERWSRFLSRLSFVVIDELHVARGVFGSHIGQVMRRLLRLARHHGADPVPVACSATVGDPGRLAAQIFGEDLDVITDDGAPRHRLSLALWDTPVLDGGRRVSSHVETARITAHLVAGGIRTIAFCPSRATVERVTLDVRRRLGPRGPVVRAYRAGLLADERRDLEDDMAAGSLGGLVATSALELGVDLAGLDAVVLDGFPGTVSSFRQRVGRAGRRGAGLAVLVAGADQLDRWMLTHPDQLVSRPPEPAVVNVSNPHVLIPHLACASHELPLRSTDARWWPDQIDDGVRRLVQGNHLEVRNRRARWRGRSSPAHGFSLRSAGGGEIRITHLGRTIGTVDRSRASRTVYPGARYLHQGDAWRVRSLDLDAGEAVVDHDTLVERTQIRSSIDVSLLDRHRRTERIGLSVSLASVSVIEHADGYVRFDDLSGDKLGEVALDLPPDELLTRGCVFDIGGAVLAAAGVAPGDVLGALHAAEHAMIGLLPLFAICDRWDVGGVSTAAHPDADGSLIVIYDGQPGGAGLADLAFDRLGAWVADTAELVEGCGCDGGCPGCVQSPKCGNGNEPLHRSAAAALLRVMAGLLDVPADHRSTRIVTAASSSTSPMSAPTRGRSVGAA